MDQLLIFPKYEFIDEDGNVLKDDQKLKDIFSESNINNFQLPNVTTKDKSSSTLSSKASKTSTIKVTDEIKEKAESSATTIDLTK